MAYPEQISFIWFEEPVDGEDGKRGKKTLSKATESTPRSSGDAPNLPPKSSASGSGNDGGDDEERKGDQAKKQCPDFPVEQKKRGASYSPVLNNSGGEESQGPKVVATSTFKKVSFVEGT